MTPPLSPLTEGARMVLPKLQAQIRGPILELYFPVELFRVVILNPLTIIKYFL